MGSGGAKESRRMDGLLDPCGNVVRAWLPPLDLYPAPGGNVEQARVYRGFKREKLEGWLGWPKGSMERLERNDPPATRVQLRELRLLLGFPIAFFRKELKPAAGVWMHGDQSEVCIRCQTFADFLCDYPTDGKTCDAPLCRDHAVKIGEELHLCPVHVALAKKETS